MPRRKAQERAAAGAAEPRSTVACGVLGAQSDSDEAGVLEELDEDLVDKLVLGDGLNHQHPLPPQLRQHGGHLHGLWGGDVGGEVGDRK